MEGLPSARTIEVHAQCDASPNPRTNRLARRSHDPAELVTANSHGDNVGTRDRPHLRLRRSHRSMRRSIRPRSLPTSVGSRHLRSGGPTRARGGPNGYNRASVRARGGVQAEAPPINRQLGRTSLTCLAAVLTVTKDWTAASQHIRHAPCIEGGATSCELVVFF